MGSLSSTTTLVVHGVRTKILEYSTAWHCLDSLGQRTGAELHNAVLILNNVASQAFSSVRAWSL